MEELAGVAVGAKVMKEETAFAVSDIDFDSLDATITLTSEAKEVEDVTISLKDLVESTEYVIEKKACEEEEGDKKDDKKDDEEKMEEEEESDMKDKEEEEEEEEESDKEEEEEKED